MESCSHSSWWPVAVLHGCWCPGAQTARTCVTQALGPEQPQKCLPASSFCPLLVSIWGLLSVTCWNSRRGRPWQGFLRLTPKTCVFFPILVEILTIKQQQKQPSRPLIRGQDRGVYAHICFKLFVKDVGNLKLFNHA